jgi:hypothetical protein
VKMDVPTAGNFEDNSICSAFCSVLIRVDEVDFPE